MQDYYDLSIAIIDDDPFWGACLSQMLAVNGYAQTSLFSSLAGFLKEPGPRPDLIFLDHALEDTDGLEALQQLQWQSPDTAVVYCTSSHDLVIAVNAMKKGAVDFLPKAGCSPEIVAALMMQLGEQSVFADKVY